MPRKPAKLKSPNPNQPTPDDVTRKPAPTPEDAPVENPQWVDLTQEGSGRGIVIIGARMPKRKP